MQNARDERCHSMRAAGVEPLQVICLKAAQLTDPARHA